MAEKAVPINITFSINKIQTLKFNLDNSFETKDLNKNSYQFGISVISNANEKTKILAIDTFIDIFIDKDKKNRILELITRIEFFINNFDEVFVKENDKIKFPNSVMYSLIGISISTTRGILTAKAEGSLLKDVYLPVVNPSKFELVPELNNKPT